MKKSLRYVKWIDSGFSLLGNVWQTAEEIMDVEKNIIPCETIGFLIHEDSDWIQLAQTINDDQIRGGYIIYKKNIIKWKDIEL